MRTGAVWVIGIFFVFQAVYLLAALTPVTDFINIELPMLLEINERLLLFFTVGQPLAWRIRFFAATM
ncbi:hypothetical protein [Xenorhabdus sp. KJ12.1]|uniref:hypothetical protein n=1 Tax=Xenorhabdus sp. KJ12.1 TaxID=1851571 RepID=UPI000C03C1B0|nr:hypothetical protein [Xenorhabdus sp. KJ12.1]PHM72984.1 hypothetical protein Xekj_00195 [Xenorhabdus sp. KJ12.1]